MRNEHFFGECPSPQALRTLTQRNFSGGSVFVGRRAKACFVTGAASVAMMCAPTAVFAQNAAGAATAVPGNSAEVRDPNEIVVTATRRSQSLQDVPLAVTSVSEAAIRSLGLTDTRDLVRLVPSLIFTQGTTTKTFNFTVRGIGTYITSEGFDQSVGVAVDGVSLARPAGSIADLVDIERVEVLEGPQGMLFGRNASAGLVNIITRRPALRELSFTGRLSYGSFDESQISASVNIPIGETLALRATGWRYRHDGYVDAPRLLREIGVKDSGGFRVRALWEPTDRLNVLVTGEMTSADQDPSAITIRQFTSNAQGVRDYELAQGTLPGLANDRTSSDKIIQNTSDTASATAEINYNLGGPTLTSVTSFRRIAGVDKADAASTSAPGNVANAQDDVRYTQLSQELRLTSDSRSRLRYVAGLIYFHLNIKDLFWFELAGPTPPGTFGSLNAFTDYQSDHYAAFGEATFDITHRLRAIAGARYSHDSVTGSLVKQYRQVPPVIVAPFNGPGAPFGPLAINSSVTDSEPSYRFGLQYDVSRDVMVYATASRGYKAAGLDLFFGITQAAFNVAQSRVQPEIAENLELGVRSQFFDRRLTFNATVFDQTFSNFQIGVRLPTATPIFAVQNAAQMKSTGATVRLEARPASGTSLSASLAYVHARFTDFINAPCYSGEPTAPVGSPLVSGVCVGGVQNMNGRPLANSPRWRVNLNARQEIPVGEYRLFGLVNFAYRSGNVWNSVADPHEVQRGYSVTDVGFGIGPANGQWQLSVYGSNIFDTKFATSSIQVLNGAYYTQSIPYEARARYGVALNFSF